MGLSVCAGRVFRCTVDELRKRWRGMRVSQSFVRVIQALRKGSVAHLEQFLDTGKKLFCHQEVQMESVS